MPVDGLGGVEPDISKHLNRRTDSISCFKNLQIWEEKATYLHSDDGVDEEEHSYQQADVWQGL